MVDMDLGQAVAQAGDDRVIGDGLEASAGEALGHVHEQGARADVDGGVAGHAQGASESVQQRKPVL